MDNVISLDPSRANYHEAEKKAKKHYVISGVFYLATILLFTMGGAKYGRKVLPAVFTSAAILTVSSRKLKKAMNVMEAEVRENDIMRMKKRIKGKKVLTMPEIHNG